MQREEEKPTFLGLFEKQKSIIFGIILATGFFFWQVVIPIREIQMQLVQINEKISNYSNQINDLNKKIEDLQDKFNNHLQSNVMKNIGGQ